MALWDTLKDYQTTNIVEKGVKFTEESFNQLCEEILEHDAQHLINLKYATGRGALMGAAGVGVIWAGVAGWKKFKNRKPKDKKKTKELLESVEVNTIELEVAETDDNTPTSRVVSRKKTDALGEIITEINDNGKKSVKRKK